METTTKLTDMFRAYMPEHTIIRDNDSIIIVEDTTVGRKAVYDSVRKIIMDTGVRKDVTVMIQTLARASM